MGLKVGVNGHRDLHKLAQAFRDAGNRKLGQKLDKGIRKAAKVVEDEVRDSTDTYMPRGFEKTFAGALTAKISVRTARNRSITITFTAKGRRQERRLTDMEQGRLRHPVHGRYRRLKNGGRMKNPWVTQRIKAGVISEPAKRSVPKTVKALDDVVAELARELNNIT